MPFQVESTVLNCTVAAKDTYALWLYAPQIAHTASPGQFVMLEAKGKFLKRPFSIAGIDSEKILLLILVIGEGTAIITSIKRNERASVFGPLGIGFPGEIKNPILVGGGIGIAPMLFVAQDLSTHRTKFTVLYGERTAESLVASDFLPKNAKIATDDGTKGFAGTVTELLLKMTPSPIFACGPQPMLASVAKIAKQWKVRAWFSLEAKMACGFGVCQGCAIETKEGYRRVCADGPVFPIEMIK